MLAALLNALESRVRSLSAWTDRRPFLAWAVAGTVFLGIVGVEVSYWPLHDYPGAMWHNTPRGDDIEQAQRYAATAGWRELAGYWTGKMIHGHAFYRPLTSWLFVGEYRLWGRQDRLWATVNITAYFLVLVAILWTLDALVSGPVLLRIAAGGIAVLRIGAPTQADRDVQSWVIGWWPCQPDSLSLLFGLLLLGCTARYIRTGKRGWAIVAPFCFFLAICFKEHGYLAAIGACLLLLRHRERRGLMWVLGALGLLLFAYRRVVLGPATGYIPGFTPDHAFRDLGRMLESYRQPALFAAIHLATMLPAAGVAWLLRGRAGLPAAVMIGVSIYAAVAIGLFGFPWETLATQHRIHIGSLILALALLAGWLLTLRRWPWLELTPVFLLAWYLGHSFNPVFGWYRWWPWAIGSLGAAAAWLALGEAAWTRLRRSAPAPAGVEGMAKTAPNA